DREQDGVERCALEVLVEEQHPHHEHQQAGEDRGRDRPDPLDAVVLAQERESLLLAHLASRRPSLPAAHPTSSRAAAKASTQARTSSSECAAESWTRIRALPLG